MRFEPRLIFEGSVLGKGWNWLSRVYDDSFFSGFFVRLLGFWDRCVSGSLFVGFVTGKELGWRRITDRPSVIGSKLDLGFKRFVGWIEKIFGKDSRFQNSFSVDLVKKLSAYVLESPFHVIGIVGCGFFGTYGIIKLLFVGISKTGLFLVLTMFIVCVLLLFVNVTWSAMIEGSWILKRLDEIDD
ncbi:MAG TPA: hypothetical protein PKV16_00275 [Caldisericia bacterium]|nr:hypothetical protein [Caldisericia bacterium]HPF49151.1 hypothetical protein [Caldisericia bacterium]HPI82985.1 hypothetical protein [Caldisericia bacterium]HPQ92212.1 hypothetical protein [Caldisericia bacterium]HRV74690.1 hypothetical protein [Caldisericia bacterium]